MFDYNNHKIMGLEVMEYQVVGTWRILSDKEHYEDRRIVLEERKKRRTCSKLGRPDKGALSCCPLTPPYWPSGT
jgi:hypothetical protein